MAHWGLCSGCLLGTLAIAAVTAATRWLDGAATWAGWGAFALLAWGAVMSVYTFDRPAPLRNPRPDGRAPRRRPNTQIPKTGG